MKENVSPQISGEISKEEGSEPNHDEGPPFHKLFSKFPRRTAPNQMMKEDVFPQISEEISKDEASEPNHDGGPPFQGGWLRSKS